ncbi:YjzD family protein [Bombilactobacillus mellis]
MDVLKYLVVLFWTIVYGQVIGFIGSSLVSATYNPMNTLIVSIIFGIILCVLPNIMQPNSKKG